MSGHRAVAGPSYMPRHPLTPVGNPVHAGSWTPGSEVRSLLYSSFTAAGAENETHIVWKQHQPSIFQRKSQTPFKGKTGHFSCRIWQERRSQVLDHPPSLLLQGQVCPRRTGYLKTGCSEPLTAGPAHPPYLIGDSAEAPWRGHRLQNCRPRFKSCLSSLFTIHLSLVLLSLRFLTCETGIILPDLQGCVRTSER